MNPKTRIITLTDRPPIKIVESDWPVIACATDDSGGGRAQGEMDAYHLRVRQHADGRTIVYGVLDAATAWTGTVNRHGGELLAAGDAVADAIRRVGEDCRLPENVIRACIAALPPEVLR